MPQKPYKITIPVRFVSPAEKDGFLDDYRDVVRLVSHSYPKRMVTGAVATQHDFWHDVASAAYVHALGYEAPVVIASLVKNFNPGQLKDFLSKGVTDPRLRKSVLQLCEKYRDLVTTDETDVNVRMATAIGDYDSLRASLIRAVDLLHVLEHKAAEKEYLTLTRNLYVPLFYYVFHDTRLSSDLGSEFVRITDLTQHQKITRALDENEGNLAIKKGALIDELNAVLGRKHRITLEERKKGVFAAYKKLTDPVKSYTPETLPDAYGIRVIVEEESGENPGHLWKRMQTIKGAVLQLLKGKTKRTLLFSTLFHARPDGQGNGLQIDWENFRKSDYSKNPPTKYRGINIPITINYDERKPDGMTERKSAKLEIQLVARPWHETNEHGGPSRIGYQNPHLEDDLKAKLTLAREAHVKGQPLERVLQILSGI
ncbi:hypothetical protein HY995_01655 [Candidatus Micrarchaeota archaeon]|nr:hypothetical protein [Candidatus Micrarchaeota archaeon]